MNPRRTLVAAFLVSCLVGQPGCGESGDAPGGATAVPSAGAAPAGAPAGGTVPAPPKTSSKAKAAPAEVYD